MLESLSHQLDAKAIVTEPADIDPWLHDWRGRFHGAAPALLAPTSTAEDASIQPE